MAGTCTRHNSPLSVTGTLVAQGEGGGPLPVFVNGRRIICLGDFCNLSCGHVGKMITSSGRSNTLKGGICSGFDIAQSGTGILHATSESSDVLVSEG